MSIMRTRIETGRSFICLALQGAGRKGINCIIDKSILNQFEIIRGGQHKFSLFLYHGVWFPDKVEILLDTPAIKYTCSDSR